MIQGMAIEREGVVCAKAQGLECTCWLLTYCFPLCVFTPHCGEIPKSLLNETGGFIYELQGCGYPSKVMLHSSLLWVCRYS